MTMYFVQKKRDIDIQFSKIKIHLWLNGIFYKHKASSRSQKEIIKGSL